MRSASAASTFLSILSSCLGTPACRTFRRTARIAVTSSGVGKSCPARTISYSSACDGSVFACVGAIEMSASS